VSAALESTGSPQRGETRRPLPAAAQQALLAWAAESSVWPLTVTDAEGNILSANEAAASLLGYSRVEFQALHLVDICSLERSSATAEVLEQIERRGTVSGVGPALHREGANVLVRYVGSKLEFEGRAFYVFSSFPLRVIDTSRTPQARGGSARGQSEITEREREILLLVGEGYENGAIARRLHLSVNTVKTYVQRVLAKLGARSRAHAVALAIRNGLID
jgi:PAS domain S-box-containing protein